jgi:hypothetical protein
VAQSACTVSDRSEPSAPFVAEADDRHPNSTSPWAMRSNKAQCDVPSLRLILFQTLYLPTGLLIGNRFTSLNVAAS